LDPVAPEALIFPAEDGDAWKPRAISNWFVGTLCPKAGITTKSLHSMRHDCATFMLSAGVPLTVVSKHMRHANSAITADTYAHLLRSQESLGAEERGAIWQVAAAAGQLEQAV
jgi:integrase